MSNDQTRVEELTDEFRLWLSDAGDQDPKTLLSLCVDRQQQKQLLHAMLQTEAAFYASELLKQADVRRQQM